MGAAIAVASSYSAAGAVKLPKLDSSQFGYKYEMEVSPAADDVDGDGSPDFTVNGSVGTEVHYGILQGTFGNNCYFKSMEDSGAGSAWRKFVSTLGNDGYTIEMRMKLDYMSGNQTWAYALSSSDGSGCDMCLCFKPGSLTWYNSTITNMVTTNAFHTYRIAKLPNQARFALWCDGALVRDSLGDAFPDSSDLNRLLLGAIGGAYGGRGKFRYFRFTKGAYAPKALMMDSADFGHRYEMDPGDARFSPTASTSDWTLGGGESGTATLADGVFSVVQPKGSMRYYATAASMDPSVTASSPFTFEIRTRVYDAWSGTDGRVLNLYCGTPRFTANLFIGQSSVVLGSNYKVIHAGNNADAMHVFRLTYEGDGEDGFTLWRDGEKIAENFFGVAAYDHARFGVASTSSHGGSFEVDYIRWTTDGAYAPYVPPPGMLLIFK